MPGSAERPEKLTAILNDRQWLKEPLIHRTCTVTENYSCLVLVPVLETRDQERD